jgi:hypothetical protein
MEIVEVEPRQMDRGGIVLEVETALRRMGKVCGKLRSLIPKRVTLRNDVVEGSVAGSVAKHEAIIDGVDRDQIATATICDLFGIVIGDKFDAMGAAELEPGRVGR